MPSANAECISNSKFEVRNFFQMRNSKSEMQICQYGICIVAGQGLAPAVENTKCEIIYNLWHKGKKKAFKAFFLI